MKKSILFSAALLLLFNVSNAQIETFDLSEFKLPYLRVERLDLDFGLNSQNHFESWKDTADFSFAGSSIDSRFQTGGIYNLYLNTPTQQSEYTVRSGLQITPFNRNKSVYDDESSYLRKNNSLSFSISANSRNRFYTNDLFFIETGPNIQFSYYLSNTKEIGKDASENVNTELIMKSNIPQLEAAIEFGGGYGRIENVTDAQMALFILKDLMKENRLDKEPTHQEIYELAELISEKRTQRFFDNRHRIIAQIQAIDSLLTSMELVNQSDATYFTTIYDNWLYARNPYRASGFRISAGPKIGYYAGISSSSTEYIEPPQPIFEDEVTRTTLDYGFWVRAIDEKPLNHFWQRRLSANIHYVFYNNTRQLAEAEKNQRKENDLRLLLSGGYGYYPNTRTYINFGMEAGWRRNNLERYFYPVDSNYDDDVYLYQRIFAGPFTSGYYYFSPQLRFSFVGSVSYNFYKTDNFNFITPPFGNGFNYITLNRFNIFINAGFTYALF